MWSLCTAVRVRRHKSPDYDNPLAPIYLGPFTQKAHECHARNQSNNSQRRSQRRSRNHVTTRRHLVMSQHLVHTHPDQYARRQSVKGAQSYYRGRVVAVEVVYDSHTNGHANGGDKSKGRCEEELLKKRDGRYKGSLDFGTTLAGSWSLVLLHGVGVSWMPNRRDARAEGYPLEHLVEDNDGEEGEKKAVSCYDKSDSND